VDLRAQRIADNERAFRDINLRLRDDLERAGDDGGLVAFVCECGHTACHESVELSVEEYRTAHVREDEFVALAGHELPDVEDVVERRERYVVVRKRDE